MYDPKDILTEDGYERYMAHLRNMGDALDYINGHYDDLHIGALDDSQHSMWHDMCSNFRRLLPVLKKGDGEKDAN